MASNIVRTQRWQQLRVQTSATALQLNHSIRLVYPLGNVGLDEETSNVLLEATNESGRYAPNNLIQDNDVIARAGRLNSRETCYISRTKAHMSHAQFYRPTDGNRINIEQLYRDLEALQQCVGRTVLAMQTFKIEDADQIRYVFINRYTDIYHNRGKITDRRVYQITLDQFLDSPIPDRWYQHALELLFRRTDRAARHVRYYSEQAGVFDDGLWKVRDTVRMDDDFEVKICTRMSPDAVRTMIEKEDDEHARKAASHCILCATPWNQTSTKAMKLRACPHVFCMECLANMCAQNGVDKLVCPLCRTEVLIETLDPNRYQFGLDQNGIYIADDRFNYWENMERSYADLDVDDHETNTIFSSFSSRGVKRDLLLQTWGLLRLHADQEPANSTPPELNPVKSAEFPVINNAVREFLLGLEEDVTTSPAALWEELDSHVLQRMTDHVSTQELARSLETLDPPTFNGLQSGDIRVDQSSWFVFTPTFWHFVRRSLNRMVNFATLRICGCQVQGLHLHGPCRRYYNPHYDGPSNGLHTSRGARRRQSMDMEDEGGRPKRAKTVHFGGS